MEQNQTPVPEGEKEKILDNKEIPLVESKTAPDIKSSDDDVKELHTKNLTPKQAIFIIEYLIDLNATQAAIRAGYSEATAKEIGYENLTKPHISKEIEKQMKYRAERTLITADSILTRMNQVAERCMQSEPVMYFDKIEGEWKQLMDDEGRAVYQFDSAGANKALENLARNQKLLTDRSEVGNLDGTNFQFPDIKEVFVDSPAALEHKEPEPGTNGQ